MKRRFLHVCYVNQRRTADGLLCVYKTKIDLLETEGETPKQPPFRPIFESNFDLPNQYSNIIVVTASDFILTKLMCAIVITADKRFKTALAANFKRYYKNFEFSSKQRPGVEGMIALPPVASQIPGKYMCCC